MPKYVPKDSDPADYLDADMTASDIIAIRFEIHQRPDRGPAGSSGARLFAHVGGGASWGRWEGQADSVSNERAL
jgi:hypothetical protein